MILKKMKKINILITCIGGDYAYTLVNCLRSSKKFKFKIIGVDKKHKVEDWFLEAFYSINKAKEKSYISAIKRICIKEKINFIIPGSEKETNLFAKNKFFFKKNNIIVPLSDYPVVNLISDKLNFYKFLKKNNIQHLNFLNINNLNQIKNSLSDFQYPSKKILLKPRNSSGSKGIFILDKSAKKIINLLDNRTCMQLSYKLFNKFITQNKFNLKGYVMMEYIEGKFFDVDCFARKGKLLYCIPRERKYINPFSPINTGCIISKNNKIINYIRKIVQLLNIDGICDFDILIYKNQPFAIDSSSRMSGSVAASLPAKINLPELIIDNYFNLNTVNLSIKKTYVKPVINFLKVNNK